MWSICVTVCAQRGMFTLIAIGMRAVCCRNGTDRNGSDRNGTERILGLSYSVRLDVLDQGSTNAWAPGERLSPSTFH